jgi:hypothetical protein
MVVDVDAVMVAHLLHSDDQHRAHDTAKKVPTSGRSVPPTNDDVAVHHGRAVLVAGDLTHQAENLDLVILERNRVELAGLKVVEAE